jgi:hypothetical protein
MIELFKAAGFESPEAMAVDHRHEITKKISIKAYDTEKKAVVWQPVRALYFKGMSDPEDTFRVTSDLGSFLCTGKHAIYDAVADTYRLVRSFSSGVANTISSEGASISAKIERVSEVFPILDAEVEGTSNYFSAGVLSHNSFGGSAKLFAEGLRKFNPLLSKFGASMIIISQERDNVGVMHGPDFKPTGGRAIKFYATNRSRVTRLETIKEKGEEVGIQIKVKNGKNKAGIPYREAFLTLMFDKGFDVDKEYVDFIISLGLVELAGAYIRSAKYGLNIQGREKFQAWLDAHPVEYEELKLQVNQMLTETTTLDAENTPDPEEGAEEEFVPEEDPPVIPE